MSPPLLAVIIVNWNVRELLSACLESLESEILNFESEIVVVDNASNDGSVDMVRERFPHVRLLANQHNPGFAGGNNQAMRELGITTNDQRRTTNGERPTANDQRRRANASRITFGYRRPLDHEPPHYVLLLNPDTVVRGQAIATMINFMEGTPQAGACGARLVYGDGSFQHSAFSFPGLAQIALDFWPIHRRLLDSRLNGRYPRQLYAAGQPFEVDHPLGAALMARTEAIIQVRLMDEEFHMYCEEIDWCWRIKRAGWKIYCVPQAEIVHYGGQSTAQARPEMVMALWRSRKRLYSKYYPAWKRRLAAALVRAGARAEIRRKRQNSALANAYAQVVKMFS